MLKIVSVIFLLMPFVSFAQEPTETEKNCQGLLAGEQKVLLKNEIKNHKEALFSSDLVKKFCPTLNEMNDEEAKIQSVVHIMAVYAYFENGCRSNANQQQALPPRSPNERPGSKTWFGGQFWLPVDASFRNKELKGTPCEVTEFTPAAQTQCAVYLAALPQDKSWTSQAFATVSRTQKWSKENEAGFRKQLRSLSPDCQLSKKIVSAKAVSPKTAPAKSQKPAKATR